MTRIGVLFVVLLGPTLACGETPDDSARKAIREVLDDQTAAWNKGDLTGFMKGYWKSDKLVFFSGDKKTSGWQATLERYQQKYQGEGKEMGELAFSELDVQLFGPDAALVRGRFTLVTT